MGTLFSSQVPALKQPETLFECVNCKGRNRLKNLLVERSNSVEDGLIEGVLICPDCGKETHSYWLSKQLIEEKIKIFGTIAILARRKTPENFRRVRELREKYQNLFDIDQVRIRNMLEQDNGRTT